MKTVRYRGSRHVDRHDTHEVFNQTPPFGDVNLVATNQPLLDVLKASGVDPEAEGLIAFGAAWGSAERLDLGRLANENPPKLRTHDARGYRIDAVEFHPAYHVLMRASMEDGLHASTWDEPRERPSPSWRGRPGFIRRPASRAVMSARSP